MKPLALKVCLYVSILMLCVSLSASTSAQKVAAEYNQATTVSPTSLELLLNTYRKSSQVDLISRDEELDAVAQARARKIVADAKVSHIDSNGKTFLSLLASGGAVFGCEVLAERYSKDAASVVNAWQKSPQHDRCLREGRIKKYGYHQIAYSLVTSGGIERVSYVDVLVLTN